MNNTQKTSHLTLVRLALAGLRQHLVLKPVLPVGVSVLLAVGCIWLIAQTIDLVKVSVTLRSANPSYIGLGVLIYIAIYVMRAVRLRTVYGQRSLPLAGLWRIASIQNLLGYLLPGQSGEIMLVYLLRQELQISVGTSVGMWFLARTFDVVGSFFWLSVAVAIFAAQGSWYNSPLVIVITLAISALIITSLMAMPLAWPVIERLLGGQVGRALTNRSRLIARLGGKLSEAGAVLRNSSSPAVMIALTLSSLGVWALIFTFYWAALKAIGVEDLSIPAVVIGASGAVLSNFIPVKGIGAAGTFEAGWVAGFTIVGVPAASALAMGVAVHVLVLMPVVALGLMALAWGMIVRLRSRQPVTT